MNRNLVIPYAVAMKKDINAEEKLLIAFLSGLSKKDGYCYASDEYLAEECGCSDRTIRRYLKHLSEIGIINIVRKGSGHSRRIFVKFDIIEDDSEYTEEKDNNDQEEKDKNNQFKETGHFQPKKLDISNQETGVSSDKKINKNSINKEKEIYKEKESPTFITLPLNDGEEFSVTEEYVCELIALYPGKEVREELKLMRAWLLDKPQKDRKTLRGIHRFVSSWLKRANGNASSPAPCEVEKEILETLERNKEVEEGLNSSAENYKAFLEMRRKRQAANEKCSSYSPFHPAPSEPARREPPCPTPHHSQE